MEVETVSNVKSSESTSVVANDHDETEDSESENDPSVEIRQNIFIRRSQISDMDIRSMLVKCTACGQQINHNDPSKVRKHRLLGVITCRECYSFYGSGEFTKGEDGYYNYCAWCGNGGKLLICDHCPNVFCNACIRRNFRRAEISETQEDGWKCYCCDSTKLKPKVVFCNMIIDYGRRKREKKDKKSTDVVNHVSQDWIKELLNETDFLCKAFQKKLLKLRDIENSGSKSIKHIVKKIEQVITVHKQELKCMVKTLSQHYNMYMELNLKREKLSVNHELSDSQDANNVDNQEKFDDEKSCPRNLNSTISHQSIERNSLEEKTDINVKETNEASCMDIDSKCNEEKNTCLHVNNSESLTESTSAVSQVSGVNRSERTHENHESKIIETITELKTEDKENILAKMSILEGDSSEGADQSAAEAEDEEEEIGADLSAVETATKLTKDNEDLFTIGTANEITGNSADQPITTIKNKTTKCSATEVETQIVKDNIDLSDLKSNQKESSNIYNSNNEDSIDDFKFKSQLKARRKLSFSGSSSNSDSSLDIPFIKNKFQKRKINLKKPANKKIHDDAGIIKACHEKKEKKKQVAPKELIDDPKLKFEARVILKDCKNMLPNGQCSVVLDNNDIDELEKIVNNLHKFSKKRPKSKSANGREDKVKSKSKLKLHLNKGDDLQKGSSSSICFSSSEEEVLQRNKYSASKTVDSNILAKNEIMNIDSDSYDSSSDSDVIVRQGKKELTKSKKKSDSSDDDFQPSRKKKYDKLLHKPLLSDDESDSKEKNKSALSRKNQTKRKIEHSDGSKERSKSSTATTSDSDVSSTRKRETSKQKKRKRIKKMASSSSENANSEKDDEKNNQSTPSGKGRKNIKKIISQKKLTIETKEAQELEKERKKRIQERQKLYNKIEDISEDGKEIITRKMVLEVDPVSKEEVVQIHPDLVQKLKQHQVNGVKFLWECTIESLKDLDKPGSGCILAHCMGLGKSLQVISFLHTCMTNKYVQDTIKTALIICPFNTALNWENEFDVWLQDVEGEIPVHQLAAGKTNRMRLDIMKYWQSDGGVLIASYDLFRRLAANKISGLKRDMVEKVHDLLLDPGPDIVVCDEGHVLRNESSAISKAVALLRTQRRIVLTGTPLQNNLKEYHVMLSFVKPHLLGNAKEFRNRFVHPIINGQYGDSSERDVKLMKKRIHILHKLLDGCVQRCDYSALAKFLPPKHEFVISIKMSDIQIKMYKCYLEKLSNAKNESKISGTTLFTDFSALRCIWTHPYLCHTSFKRTELRKLFQEEEEDDNDFINDSDEESDAKSSGSASNKDNSESGDEVIKSYKTRSRSTRNNFSDDEIEELPVEQEEKQWYHEFISDEDKCKIELSGKMVLLVDILKECESIGDKILVFSQSLLTLDLIEDILENLHHQSMANENSQLQGQGGQWLKGKDYFRMDGSTSAEFRKNYIDMFNDLNNYRSRLFLISTRAGSLGTNLVGANRVIIMDTSWNPSHDVQAIFRVYRFGQVKPVYIYRFLAQGTMEEKIYDRQVTKLSLSIRVVDEQQIDRHFSADDLAALYTFTPESTSNRPTPMIPKDRLLAEMLIKNNHWIVTYHEHDSLLQNETEEDLTEEERKMAWAEYENEREGHPTNAGLLNDEVQIFYEEPDFTQATYQGPLIPDLQTIVNSITSKLAKQHVPNSVGFFNHLISCLLPVRSVFQGKQVKILRMKQEFFKRGSVPESVNKYLDEVNKILTSMNAYISRVQQAIKDAQNAAAKIVQGDQQRPQAQSNTGNNATFRQFPQLANQLRMQPPNFRATYQVGNQRFNVTPNMASFTSGNVRATTAGNARFLPGNIRNFPPGNVRYVQVPFQISDGVPQFPGSSNTAFSKMQERLAHLLKPETQKNEESFPVVTEADEFILPDENDSSSKNDGPSGKSSVVIEEIE